MTVVATTLTLKDAEQSGRLVREDLAHNREGGKVCDRYIAARLPGTYPSPQGQEHERTTMENLALAEEPAGSDELHELYKLEASESEPEEEDEEDREEEHGGVEPENTPDE